jgi:diguanylate cyclase (GGDEF)-like protein/PAS domain S-box-containing protein
VHLDVERLDRALARSVAETTSADEVYAAVCSVVRAECGDGLLVSVYVGDEDRLWLSAQRGYDQVVHTHIPGAGIYSRVYADGRSVAIERAVQADPAYVEVVRDIESLCAARFVAEVVGVIGIESHVRLDEETGLAIVESAARAIEHALCRVAVRDDQRAYGRRLRLLRAVSALAALEEPLAILELLARSVGDALGLDLVQVALVRDGALEPRVVWSRSQDRSLYLDRDAFRARAGRFAHALVHGSEEEAATVVGVPLRIAGELLGYLLGRSHEIARETPERIDEALVAATTAAQSLAALDRERELRGSQDELRASKESLDHLIESVAEYVFCLEREPTGELRVVTGQGHLLRVLGQVPPEGTEPAAVWLAAIPADDRAEVEKALEGALGGGPVDLEHRLELPGGVCRTYRLRGRFRRDQGRVLFDAMAADVTARRRAELGRERAEKRYQAVVESLSEGLIVMGLDGRAVSANASAQRILGRSEHELLAAEAIDSWSIVGIDGTPVERLDKPGFATLRDGKPVTGTIMGVHRPDGELCWIEENTRPLYGPEGALEAVVVTFADVTERFEADRRVRAERDFTARVLDTIADGVLVTDELEDGGRKIVHVNDRICEITGYAREELLGARTPFPWWPEDRHVELTTAFEEATASGSGEYEARFRRRDGASFPALVSVGAVHLDDAEQRAWVITVKDLSQRNALLAELQASRSDMERVLASVDDYLYTYQLTPDGGSSLVRELSRPVALVGDVEETGCVGTDSRWLAATHPDDRAGVSEAGRRLLAGRPVDYEHRVRDRDGLERWVWVRERPERISDGRLLVHGAMTDVTARKEAEGQLGEAFEEARRSYGELSELHDQMRRIVGSIDELFYTDELGPDGVWHSSWIGDNWRKFIGDPAPDVEAQEAWDSAVHPDDRGIYDAVDSRILALEAVDFEYRLVDSSGETRWVFERMRPSGRRTDGTLVVDGVIQDITERKRSEARLEEALALAVHAREEADLASRTDALTGLANRRHFAEELSAALDATRPGQALGLLLLDIDHFKRTNDTYGHAAGDAVLREVALQLETVVRTGDIVARIGGEELAVVMPGGGRPEVLRVAGERVRTLVAAASVLHDDADIPFTVSVGAASSVDASTADSLLAAADRAMYAAKRRGRDRVCLFSELVGDDFLAEVPESLRIAEALALTVSVREGMPPLHNQQVAELAGAIARELDLPQQGILRCQVSGWLHDIGKTAIPDAILAKPGELTEEEWTQMRRHPEIGEAIVRRISGLADAALGVRHHHERWDGSGYPDRLANEEISLEARVVAVADAYSAITSRRPYQRERSREEAIVELRASAGGHLDPQVVEALCRALRVPSPLAVDPAASEQAA